MSETYQDIVTAFGEDKIRDRFLYTELKANEFIKEAGYSSQVVCNHKILQHVVIDYFADVLRLKDFHNIEQTNKDKITAYLVAWIIKRKPLQYVDNMDDEENDIFVNERFAISIIINECIFSENMPLLVEKDLEKFENYIQLLLYYLKYRECNPQVLELALASFKMGKMVIQGDLNLRKEQKA